MPVGQLQTSGTRWGNVQTSTSQQTKHRKTTEKKNKDHSTEARRKTPWLLLVVHTSLSPGAHRQIPTSRPSEQPTNLPQPTTQSSAWTSLSFPAHRRPAPCGRRRRRHAVRYQALYPANRICLARAETLTAEWPRLLLLILQSGSRSEFPAELTIVDSLSSINLPGRRCLVNDVSAGCVDQTRVRRLTCAAKLQASADSPHARPPPRPGDRLGDLDLGYPISLARASLRLLRDTSLLHPQTPLAPDGPGLRAVAGISNKPRRQIIRKVAREVPKTAAAGSPCSGHPRPDPRSGPKIWGVSRVLNAATKLILTLRFRPSQLLVRLVVRCRRLSTQHPPCTPGSNC